MKHRTRSSFVLLASLILLSCAALAQTLKFHLTDLNPTVGYRSTANAINNNGQVAGDVWYYFGSQRCFLWGFKGGPVVFYVALRGVPDSCDAAAINQLGEVAGSYRTSLSGNPYHPFRRDAPAVIHGLTPLYDIPGDNAYAAC